MMDRELMDIWQRYRPQLSRRAEFFDGGSIGGVCHVTHAMAIEMHDVVRDHFTRALRVLITCEREWLDAPRVGRELI